VKLPCFLLLLVVTLVGSAEAATRKTSSAPQGDSLTRYVSLRKWAAQKGFSYRHNSAKNECVLSSKWSTLQIQKDNRRAIINGVSVWLSVPPTGTKETIYVSERDINSHLNAILYPAKMPKGQKVRTIVLSAGHGGRDPGYVIGKQEEKAYTLLLAKELREMLVRAGFKVVMTREKDEYISLEEQAAIANRAKGDLFINLHFNAHMDRQAQGVEVYCLTTKGAKSTNGGSPAAGSPGNRNDPFNILLAYQMQRSLTRDLDLVDRGVRRAQFVVLRDATVPSILVEGGFMSNPSDAKKIFEAKYRRQMAQSIFDGILAYKKLVER
jgi:N-acetylmuramoyl-L-alanine amidase